ncbi:MAG: apolipoprotein N-acyltransferase [Fidelibacterota bacterium]|nr:MAG: apolipoprotein N-acyltransferase [Candidatus Neomarinimicrobiota bacterium]
MNSRDIITWSRNLPDSWKLVLAGVVTGLSFPPVPLGFLAWIGLVPLINAWLKSSSPSRSAWYGFLWSLGFLFVVMYWLALNTGTYWWAATMSMVAAVLFLSLNYALIGWWFGWLHARRGRVALWLLPLVWVCVEFLRSFGTLGFPWIALANSQTGFLLLIQNTEIFGIYGLSFWIVLINILVVDLLHAHKKLISALILVGIFLFPWLSGWLLLPEVPEPTLRVGVVQPNVNAAEKWMPEIRDRHFNQLIALTRLAAVDSPDVVFWPEAATPAYLRRGGRGYLRQIQEELRLLRLPVVTGMPDFQRLPNGNVHYYNAVGFLDSMGIRDQQYNKIQLVPFGEYIPLSKWIPALNSLNLGQGNFTHGTEYTVFSLGSPAAGEDSISFSVGVCFETTFPGLNRRFVREGASFLVGVVNDAWYQTSSGPYQHAAQARFRAVEFRRPMVRAANTGISMVIDQAGKVVAYYELNKEGVFTASIAPATDMTFYTRFGDLFALLSVLAAMILSIVAHRNHLRAGGQSEAA